MGIEKKLKNKPSSNEMKKIFGIICLLGATSAGLLKNEVNPTTLASCDIFKNDTQRAALLQNFSDNRIDKNGDGSLSAWELSDSIFDYGYCYGDYTETGREHCELNYRTRKYDQDKNDEISGQELCGFWKAMVVDKADEVLEDIRN